MKRVELLSPAGNFECLKAAIHNGCDAVYLAGQLYGARKYANNFSEEELEKAINYAHIYGVKVYITINTLIDEKEVSDFLEYTKRIYLMGVDAVIMQDLGMIKEVHELYPDLEIHASTQTHNHNEEGIKLLKSLGVKRVVLARELSLNEINNINVDIEKEVFIHGALCIAYSGECLASSIILGRSGNKGECAGICRLPFSLYEDNKQIKTEGDYLLSTKELCTIDNLKEILDSNISSLKIEGRMKSPEYVGYITKLYRLLIDKYYNNEELTITEEDYKNLKQLYNREFTKGFINNESKKDIVNIKTPNHQGILLGKVLEIKNKIKIKLYEELNQNDGIRFSNNEGMIANFIYNEKGLLINHANKNEIIYLDNKVNLKETKEVLKITDSKLNEKLKNYEEKKLKIDFIIKAKLNETLTVILKYKDVEIEEKSITVTNSINNPTTKEDIIEKISKLGNTPFIVNKIEIDIDNDIFIPIKEVNNIRRQLIDKLTCKLMKIDKKMLNEHKKLDVKMNKTNEYSFLARTEEQIKTLINKNVNIYIEDYILYKKYKNDKVFYRTPRVNNNLIDIKNENILCTELGSLNKYKENNNIVSDIYMNVKNNYTANMLNNLQIKKIGISPEVKDEDLIYFNKNLNLELLIYGKIELMLMKYCPLNKLVNKDKICKVCKNNCKYKLKDRNNEYYDIYNNNCITTILNYKNINKIRNIEEYKNIGITNFRIDLYDETKEDIIKILKELDLN